jgi:hypothetical protein
MIMTRNNTKNYYNKTKNAKAENRKRIELQNGLGAKQNIIQN